METNLEWKEPPNPVRYKKYEIDWASIADSLRARPNEWALVAQDVNPSTVTHIRRGRLKAFGPEGAFEASGQGRNESGYTQELYVRYVGESSKATVAEHATTAPMFVSDNLTRTESITPETNVEVNAVEQDYEFAQFGFVEDPEL